MIFYSFNKSLFKNITTTVHVNTKMPNFIKNTCSYSKKSIFLPKEYKEQIEQIQYTDKVIEDLLKTDCIDAFEEINGTIDFHKINSIIYLHKIVKVKNHLSDMKLVNPNKMIEDGDFTNTIILKCYDAFPNFEKIKNIINETGHNDDFNRYLFRVEMEYLLIKSIEFMSIHSKIDKHIIDLSLKVDVENGALIKESNKILKTTQEMISNAQDMLKKI